MFEELEDAKTHISVLERRVTMLIEERDDAKAEVRVLRQKLNRLEGKRKSVQECPTPSKRMKISNCDLLNEIHQRQLLRDNEEYPSLVRDFAFQMNYYSPKAYEFLRKSLNNKLPHPKTLPRWSDHVNVEPGEKKFVVLMQCANPVNNVYLLCYVRISESFGRLSEVARTGASLSSLLLSSF